MRFERSTPLVKIFYERDAKPEALKGKTIAILGYGSQGHAQAQNLRDSGYKVIVGLDPSRKSAKQAQADGMVVAPPDEAAKRADWIHVLTPDETQGELYEKSIKPYLHPGKVLGVSHGFSIHFKTIVPPTDVAAVIIAPKSPGPLVGRGIGAVQRRTWSAVADRNPTGCQRARARTRAGLCAWDRIDARGSSADDIQGRNRERPVWRAGSALRRVDVTD